MLAGAALLLAFGGGVLLWENRQAALSARIPLALQVLLSTLKDAETGQRGYLLTGDDSYLKPYRLAFGQVPKDLADAEAATGHSPEFLHLHDLVTRKLTELDDAVAMRSSGRTEQAPAVAKTDLGEQTMDEIRGEVARRSAAAAAASATHERAAHLALAFAVTGAAAIVALGLAGIVGLLRARSSLAASETRLRLLVAGIHDHAIYMLDESGLILTWNTGAERLKGFSAAEAVGQPYAMLFSPEDRRIDLPSRLLATARAEGSVQSEGVRVRRDGSTFTAHISLTALFDEAGNTLGYCKVARNVTEQREAERVLARDRAELERLVAERSRTLEEAQTRLAHVHRMEALGQLAGGIAHDFNNVLQAVHGCASLIEVFSGDPARVRRLAHTAADASERGSAITRRLLAFSRRGDLRTEVVDPSLLLANMRELLIHTLGSAIKIVVHATDELSTVLVDKGQLETVLINLATNARDAMSGAGLLTLAAVVDEVDERSRPGRYPEGLKPGTYVRISVTDTGAGMTPEVLARVSEPFFTTKPAGKGTGLGLAMACGFCEQSGGGMRIESLPGKGTTVMLWLPRVDGEMVPDDLSRPTSLQQTFRNKGARVLLVDDDLVVRDIVTLQLETAGYAVLPAQSGPEALAAIEAGEVVDLIIADLSMPEMDGIACIREVHEKRRELPAILMTGFATNAAEIAVQGALTSDFTLLRKPISAEYLVERIEHLLARAKRSAK